MSAIANFQKRRAAEKAKHADKDTAANTTIPVNEALQLLAYLLSCEESEAIDKARVAVEQKARFVEMHVALASGEDKSVTAEVTTDSDGQITDISEINTELSDSADSVNQAAENVELATDNVAAAASDVSEASSDLAYRADDIASAAADIKEATTELKKPSAGQKSSPGVKSDKAKSSSKK